MEGIQGDANFDGKVDVGDLGILAANYGRTGGAVWMQGDFNRDGAVDVGDLGILAANYGQPAASSRFAGAEVREETPIFSDLGCGPTGMGLIAGLMATGILLIPVKPDE